MTPAKKSKKAAKRKISRKPAAKKTATVRASKYGLRGLTPVMIVDAVEPCLPFWRDRLGFKVENEVPGPDGRLIFASATDGKVEVMYQTKASVIADDPSSAGRMGGHSVALFISVGDLDLVERAMAGAPVVKPRHKTFYGSTELYVREPGGNVVGFAQMG